MTKTARSNRLLFPACPKEKADKICHFVYVCVCRYIGTEMDVDFLFFFMQWGMPSTLLSLILKNTQAQQKLRRKHTP